MTFWAIIPVKPLKQGKSRLSNVLSVDERYVLNATMLGNTLKALRQSTRINQILVVSRDTGVLAAARDFGAHTFQEDMPSNLNRAVTLGVRMAMAEMADRILILPADIPMVESHLIDDLASRISGQKQMVIVPDRHEDGTNALIVCPPDAIHFQFGPGSFHKHLHQAESIGLKTQILHIPALALDLDLPEDLEVFRQSTIQPS